jgi:hypothetical protein
VVPVAYTHHRAHEAEAGVVWPSEREKKMGGGGGGGPAQPPPRKALEVLKLVVVWCLAGDDVEMSSEGHENRKQEGGARR